jgi:hypothetical protein
MWRDATTTISILAGRYKEKVVVAATITGQATIKFIKTPKTDIFRLKIQGPLKTKNNGNRNNGKS